MKNVRHSSISSHIQGRHIQTLQPTGASIPRVPSLPGWKMVLFLYRYWHFTSIHIIVHVLVLHLRCFLVGFPIMLILLFIGTNATAQLAWNKDGSVAAGSTGVTLYSPVYDGITVQISDMVKMNFKEAIRLNQKGEISMDVGPNGWIEVKVTTMKQENNTWKKGSMIYQGYMDAQAQNFQIKPMDLKIVLDYADLHTECTTTDIQCLAQEAQLDLPAEDCTREVNGNPNGFWDFFYGLISRKNQACREYHPQPVAIELFISNATVKTLKIPGIGQVDLPGVFGAPPSYPYDFNSFAVIGDYGCAQRVGGNTVEHVAEMINNWDPKPNFIVSVGDDSYHQLSPQYCGGSGFDDNVGQFFHDYIKPYSGSYGNESPDINQFYPVTGNWDYVDKDVNFLSGLSGEKAWRTFFDKTETQAQYYDYIWGDIHFFALNSNNRQGPSPNPVADENSIPAQWLKAGLKASQSKWNIVYMHHPPYKSKTSHPDNTVLQWPFKTWGADLVISGDEHFYERHVVDGLTYVINGSGGGGLTTIPEANYRPTMVAGTHYQDNYGAMRVQKMGFKSQNLVFHFYNIDGVIMDEFIMFEDGDTYYYDRTLPQMTSSETVDLFLLLGQSNMASRCTESNTSYGRCPFDPEDQGYHNNVYLLNDKGKLETATNPINQYSTVAQTPPTWTRVNVGWTFGPKVYQSTNTNVGLISNARGGVTISQWFHDYKIKEDGNFYQLFTKLYRKRPYSGGNLYEEALDRTKKALQGYSGATLRAILWLQGESDAGKLNDGTTTQAAYLADMGKVFNQFRSDMNTFKPNHGYNNLPILIGEVRPDAAAPPGALSHAKVNAALKAYADSDPHAYLVSSKDLTVLPDYVHYDLASQKTFGKRYADVYLQAMGYSNARTGGKGFEEGLHDDTMTGSNSAKVFPNPASGHIRVQFSRPPSGPVLLELTDISGKKLKTIDFDPVVLKNKGTWGLPTVTINTAHFHDGGSGAYILNITNGGKKESHRVIIN